MQCMVRNVSDVSGGEVAWILQGTGVPQGCPMSTLLFCAVIADVIERTEARAGQLGLRIRVVAYADDIYIVGHAADFAQAYTILADELARVELRCAGCKTKLWCSSQQALNALPKIQAEVPIAITARCQKPQAAARTAPSPFNLGGIHEEAPSQPTSR